MAKRRRLRNKQSPPDQAKREKSKSGTKPRRIPKPKTRRLLQKARQKMIKACRQATERINKDAERDLAATAPIIKPVWLEKRGRNQKRPGEAYLLQNTHKARYVVRQGETQSPNYLANISKVKEEIENDHIPTKLDAIDVLRRLTEAEGRPSVPQT